MNDYKREYTAPQLAIVTFRTEHGYALSGSYRDGFFQLFDIETSESNTMESWTDHDTWGSSGDGFF